MNPYVYSRGRRHAAPKSSDLIADPHYSVGELMQAIFNIRLNSTMALAIVLFMAGSVASMSLLARVEMSQGFSEEDAVQLLASRAPLGRVLAQNTGVPRIGTLVNIGPAVYLVGQQGLYGFTNMSIFYSWGYTFSLVREANTAERALPQAGIIPARVGFCLGPMDQIEGRCVNGDSEADLARADQLVFIDRTVYLVAATGLYGVPSSDIFRSWGWEFENVDSANSIERALPVLGFVPLKNSACGTPLEQIAGTCSLVPLNDSDSSPDYSLNAPAGEQITAQLFPDLFVKGVTKGVSPCFGAAPDSCHLIQGLEPNPNVPRTTRDNFSTLYDYCLTSTQLNEGYIQRAAGKINYRAFSVPAGHTCSSGAFVSNQPGNAASSTPVFYAGSPIPVTSAFCGSRINFSVLNYPSSQVWITQYKNGSAASSYNQIDIIPDAYNLICNQDEGTYLTEAYTVVNGQRGVLLGKTTFTVHPINSNPNTPSSTPTSIAFYEGVLPVTSSTCGRTVTFKVTGYSGSQVWLTQYKNSSFIPTYDKIDFVPDTYTLVCNKDEGTYTNYAYAFVNGQKGVLLGTTIFVVNAASPNDPAGPTAALTANNQKNITVNVGDTVNYAWNATNADSVDSYYSANLADACGNYFTPGQNVPWVANTISGSQAGRILSCQAGVTYTITYRASKAGASAVTGSVTVTVNPAGQAASNAAFTFYPNGGTLAADRDSWTFTLYNAKTGDTLAVDASKNGNSLGRLEICTVAASGSPVPNTSCTKTVTPSASDAGTWTEIVYINGVQKGTANFTVQAQGQNPSMDLKVNGSNGPITLNSGGTVSLTYTLSSHPWSTCVKSGGWSGSVAGASGSASEGPLNSSQTFYLTCYLSGIPVSDSVSVTIAQAEPPYNPTFTFTPNGGDLTAGTDSWRFDLKDAKAGDTLLVYAYKGGNFVGQYNLCTVASGQTSCTASATPSLADVGSWYEQVYLNNGAQILQKGTVSFTVSQ